MDAGNEVVQDFEFYSKNPELYDSLTNDQILELGRGGVVATGDTVAAAAETDTDASPSAGADEQKADTEEIKPEAKPAESDAVEVAGVLTKDGKHIIPFSELKTERDKAAQFEELSKSQAALIEDLKAAKEADKGTGTTDAQDDVLAAFKADFKENYEELDSKLTPLVQAMIDASGNKSEVSELRREIAELKAALIPIQKEAFDNSVDTHFSAIRNAVPDFDAIVKSGEVDKWVEALPGYARPGAMKVLYGPAGDGINAGTAAEVIELLGQYKESLGVTAKPASNEQNKADAKTKAAQVIAQAKRPTPKSLSSIPSAAPDGEVDQISMTSSQLLQRYEGKDSATILKELARLA